LVNGSTARDLSLVSVTTTGAGGGTTGAATTGCGFLTTAGRGGVGAGSSAPGEKNPRAPGALVEYSEV